MPNTTTTLVGWTPESSGRGTLSILTTTTFTIFICTWTCIHPRVHPNPHLFRLHKLAQLCKTVLAPEMICLESLQEWCQARKMVQRLCEASGGEFGMVQGFFVGMLGVRYRVGGGYRVLWPSQYVWLLNSGLVEWRDHEAWGLGVRDIRDKNKADGLVKFAAVCQVCWFVLQCVTRVVHGFPIAALEAMTLAYVVVVVVTYGFWWLKPKDVTTAHFVELPEMSVMQWEVFEGLAMEDTYDVEDKGVRLPGSVAWYLVSRDCRDDEVLVMGRKSLEKMDGDPKSPLATLRGVDARRNSLGIRRTKATTRAIPIATQEAAEDPRIITEWDEGLYMSRYWPLICLLGTAFGALHLISWDTTFPTTVEKWLWRTSALVSVVTSIVVMQFRTVSFRWTGPLTILRIGSPVLYLISRLIMMVEVFASLRAMPADTYDTYVMSNYWLHIV